MKIIAMLVVIVLSFSFNGCSNCDGENPSVTLKNTGTGKADIQVKTSGGNTENINNVLSGTHSEARYFAPGNIEFTINIQGVADPVVYNLQASTCYDYVVRINEDNTVSATSNERK